MARAKILGETAIPAEPNQLPGVALPRAQTALFGHLSAERTFLDAYRSGRMHHAWLITGPHGIGKATLAFRAAKFVLAHGDPRLPAVERADSLAIDPASPVVQRVSAGGHGEVLHLTRDWDHDRKRFKQDLTVDTIRRTTRFFGTTASEGGWRVAIVDAADDMNANSANALLKILEEPPQRSLFFVLAHVPGRLLPTIRSRCRTLPLSPLADGNLRAALANLGLGTGAHDRLDAAIALAEGSVRAAAGFLAGSGLDLVTQIDHQLGADRPEAIAVHALADAMARGTGDEAFEIFQIRLRQSLSRRARDCALRGETPMAARLAEISRSIERDIVRTESFNLDRRQLVLSVFRTLAGARASA